MGSVTTMISGLTGSDAWVNLATYDVPISGRIEGVCVSMHDDSDADGDQVMINLSFAATPGIPPNGDLSSIMFAGKRYQLVTSGSVVNQNSFYVKLPDVPVSPGQRLYLHGYGTTGVSATVAIALHMTYNVQR